MADVVDRATRSRMMSNIKGKNTLPERRVRSFLHRAGLRFRLHDRRLPGRPDIIFPRYRAVVFVHGCFWHQHPGCKDAVTPKSNASFWLAKLARNVERDSQNHAALVSAGWRVFTVWECEINEPYLKELTRQIQGPASIPCKPLESN